jgi:hypothetical protein
MKQRLSIKIVILLLPLLVYSLAAESAALNSGSQSTEQPIAIQSRSPRNGGVKSGMVIVYGHPIKPPYLMVFRQGKLYMNDVQVEPSLYVEREKAQIPAEAYQAEFGNIASKVGGEIQKMSREGKSSDEILKFARSQQGVKNVHLERPDSIMMEIEADGRVSPFGVALPPRGSKPPAAIRRDQMTPAVKLKIETDMTALKQGKCIIYLSQGGTSSRFMPKEFKAEIMRIMLSPELDQEQRIRQVADKFFFGAKWPAQDIVTNFTEAEWK